jgi:hypothetical protein
VLNFAALLFGFDVDHDANYSRHCVLNVHFDKAHQWHIAEAELSGG